MSIATELENFNMYLTEAYNKCEEKGAEMPIFKNMQSLTPCIESISGGGADLTSIGSTVTVESMGAIKEGGRWVGVLNNEYASETLGEQVIGTAPTYLSEDLLVGISGATIKAESTVYLVFFFDELTNTYISYEVDLTGVAPEFGGTSTTPVISNDGKLVVFGKSNSDVVITIEINKEDKRATAYLSHLTHTMSNTTTYVADASNGTYFMYIGNVIKDPASSAILHSSGLRVERYNYGSHSFSFSGLLAGNQNYTAYSCPNYAIGKSAWVDSNTLVAISSGSYAWLIKLTFDENGTEVAAKLDSSIGSALLSGNATRMVKSTTLYSFNPQDLTYTQIGTLNSGTYYLDKTGNFAITSAKTIYDITSVDASDKGTLLYTASETITPARTKMIDINKWTNGSKIFGFPQGSTAKYLISPTSVSNVEAGKYYGIASSTLNLGDVGEAQLLFIS